MTPAQIRRAVRSYPRAIRTVIGLLLVLGGLLGLLPILSFWMLPLGLMVLCYDMPIVWRALARVWLCWRWHQRASALARDRFRWPARPSNRYRRLRRSIRSFVVFQSLNHDLQGLHLRRRGGVPRLAM